MFSKNNTKELRMNKEEASQHINAFIYEFFPDACYTKNSEVKDGENGDFYKVLKRVGRKGPGIELWYENWDGKWIFALAMSFSKETFKKYFPNYTKSEYYIASYWNCQKMPKFGRLTFQRNDDKNYYLSLYIKEGMEYESIQKFYSNQEVKKVCHFDDKCTECLQQSWTRIGQGIFRDKMIKMWNGACSVTGCKMKEVLVASHAKPWRDCNPKEKVDEHNGLLLVPNLDVLFDKFFITFDEKGRIQIRKEIEKECKKLNITKNMKVDLARLNESEVVSRVFRKNSLFQRRF